MENSKGCDLLYNFILMIQDMYLCLGMLSRQNQKGNILVVFLFGIPVFVVLFL